MIEYRINHIAIKERRTKEDDGAQYQQRGLHGCGEPRSVSIGYSSVKTGCLVIKSVYDGAFKSWNGLRCVGS
jgi:hypothetical protein